MKKIEDHLNKIDLDIRKTKNTPRFIDQKCTPDVLSFVADSIINLNKNDFNRTEIQKSDYFCKTVVLIYGKPSPNNKNLDNEYDKFISQVLNTLTYAKILERKKVGRAFNFKIINKDILEYISLRDRNAFNFLHLYLEKFFKDSGFDKYLKIFFNDQNSENFKLLKTKFENLVISNSELGTRGSETGGLTDVRRMFPKSINPIALSKNKRGTAGGFISKGIVTYSELVYNRQNFRDIGNSKLKNISRKEQEKITEDTKEYNKHLMNKAKQWVKRNHPQSEVKDDLCGKTAHAHHIFPKRGFPEIADYIENLIALTGGQHVDKAHPNGKTTEIDILYQCVCLKSKKETIQRELSINDQTHYSKQNFIKVLNTGFKFIDSNNRIEYNASFDVIDDMIDTFYKSI